MAHEFRAKGTSPAILRNSAIDEEALQAARIDLAACFRMAARLGMSEGICNHFSAIVPGRDDLFIVNPYGLSFSEVTASSLLVCDYDGNVISGEGQPEATAFYIHGRLHMRLPRARVAFHTHMPHATALSMVEGDPLVWAGQTALKFYGRTAIDRDYNGLALDEAEGDRIAGAMGDADIVFMKTTAYVRSWSSPLDRRGLGRFVLSRARLRGPGPRHEHRSQADPGRTRYRPQNLRPDAWRRFRRAPDCIWRASSAI